MLISWLPRNDFTISPSRPLFLNSCGTWQIWDWIAAFRKFTFSKLACGQPFWIMDRFYPRKWESLGNNSRERNISHWISIKKYLYCCPTNPWQADYYGRIFLSPNWILSSSVTSDTDFFKKVAHSMSCIFGIYLVKKTLNSHFSLYQNGNQTENNQQNRWRLIQTGWFLPNSFQNKTKTSWQEDKFQY